MRIVVTGATGNIGTHLLQVLRADPEVDSVVGLARRLPERRDPEVEWQQADVTTTDLVPLLRGADAVVHLAFLLQPAHDPDLMHRTNVFGSRRVFDAVAAAGVPALVHASSVGAYAPGRGEVLTEAHPATGISSSTYSRHKVSCETELDRLQQEHPDLRIVRIRPGVVLSAPAASALARYFLGPFVPQSLVRRALLPVIPDIPNLALQAVHSADVARAFALAATGRLSGAVNVAADPVLTPAMLAAILGARLVPVPRAGARALLAMSWHLRLQPTDPGWLDLGTSGLVMDITRARTELGWAPEHDAAQTVREVVTAMGRGQGRDTPVLRPRATGLSRWREAARGLLPGAGGTG